MLLPSVHCGGIAVAVEAVVGGGGGLIRFVRHTRVRRVSRVPRWLLCVSTCMMGVFEGHLCIRRSEWLWEVNGTTPQRLVTVDRPTRQYALAHVLRLLSARTTYR